MPAIRSGPLPSSSTCQLREAYGWTSDHSVLARNSQENRTTASIRVVVIGQFSEEGDLEGDLARVLNRSLTA